MGWGWTCCCESPTTRDLRVVAIHWAGGNFVYDPEAPLANRADVNCFDGGLNLLWQIDLEELSPGPGAPYYRRANAPMISDDGYVFVTWGRQVAAPDPLPPDFPIFGSANFVDFGMAKINIADGSIVWDVALQSQVWAPFSHVVYLTGPDFTGRCFARDGRNPVINVIPHKDGSDWVVAFEVDQETGAVVRKLRVPYLEPDFFGYVNLGVRGPGLALTFDPVRGYYYHVPWAGSGSLGQIFKFQETGEYIGRLFTGGGGSSGDLFPAAGDMYVENSLMFGVGRDNISFDNTNSIDEGMLWVANLDTLEHIAYKESDFEIDLLRSSGSLQKALSAPSLGVVAVVLGNCRIRSVDPARPPNLLTSARGGVAGIPKSMLGGTFWQTPLWKDPPPLPRLGGPTEDQTELQQTAIDGAIDPVSGRLYIATWPSFESSKSIYELDPNTGDILRHGDDTGPGMPYRISNIDARSTILQQ